MNIKNIKRILVLTVVSTLAFTSCNKFLDINENPNNPDKATPSLLLPSVQAAASQVTGNAFQVYGNFWAQFWTQNPSSSQYRTIDQYRVLTTATDRAWSIIYRSALVNAEQIINSEVLGQEYYKGIAYIMKAYTFQMATDAFGDIPLSEALQGKEYMNPSYSKQADVYDSIFTYLDKGKALLKTKTAEQVTSQDMIFGGDKAQWEAFANTLALRAYLRLSSVNSTKAANGIKALYAAKAPFLTQDASITYTNTGGNENPMYNEMLGLGRTQNAVASSTAVSAFIANKDPRRFKFYQLRPEATEINSIPQGSYNVTKDVSSAPNALVGANGADNNSAVAPAKLISAAESFFLQAEAVTRGWGSGSAEALYNAGIEESFHATGLTADAAKAYIATAPDAKFGTSIADNTKAIITQKYFAMCGFQGFEAWTEWRRTGYPTFFVQSVASTLGAGLKPLRLPYPNSEITTNANFPGSITVDKPVWWDVK